LNDNIQVKIDGLDELIKAFAGLSDDAIRNLREPTIVSAHVVMEQAKRLTHDVSGDLDLSMKIRKPTQRDQSKTKVFSRVYLSKGGKHGAPLEFGHKLVYMGRKTNVFIPAHPFMRPAAEKSEPEVVRYIAAAMRKTIEDMGGK
jgi:HK97 gp10 family phage protein